MNTYRKILILEIVLASIAFGCASSPQKIPAEIHPTDPRPEGNSSSRASPVSSLEVGQASQTGHSGADNGSMILLSDAEGLLSPATTEQENQSLSPDARAIVSFIQNGEASESLPATSKTQLIAKELLDQFCSESDDGCVLSGFVARTFQLGINPKDADGYLVKACSSGSALACTIWWLNLLQTGIETKEIPKIEFPAQFAEDTVTACENGKQIQRLQCYFYANSLWSADKIGAAKKVFNNICYAPINSMAQTNYDQQVERMLKFQSRLKSIIATFSIEDGFRGLRPLMLSVPTSAEQHSCIDLAKIETQLGNYSRATEILKPLCANDNIPEACDLEGTLMNAHGDVKSARQLLNQACDMAYEPGCEFLAKMNPSS